MLTDLSSSRKQREYANKIKPIRKNGHLLLVTLLLANMIVNETLPVISDPVLGGGFQSVVVSTVLIVMYVSAFPCLDHFVFPSIFGNLISVVFNHPMDGFFDLICDCTGSIS